MAHPAANEFWPLVGRDREMASVCAAVRAGTTPVVDAGEAGIGKTRLVRECLGVVAGEGVEVEWTVAGAAARSISLGALAPWLGGTSGPGLVSLQEMATALRAAICDRRGDRPVVLAVDDAQWLDDASATVVAELALSSRPQLVLTARSDEPLHPALATVVAGGSSTTVRLSLLSQADVRQLVPEILAGALDTGSAHRLWRWSEGNPLWLRELVLDALATGRLAEKGGVWHWDDAACRGPRSRLVDLLRDRLSVADAGAARWLDLVALSEPLPVELAEAMIGGRGLASLVADGLVVVDGGVAGGTEPGWARFSHPLFGELLRAAVPTLRARNLWRALVQAEEDGPRRAVEARRRAAWRLEADLPVPLALAVDASDDALDHADPALAERVARTAADASMDGSVDPALRAELAVNRVAALARLGRWGDVLEQLGQLEPASLGGDQRARLALVQLWPHLYLGDLSAADRFLADAETSATTPELRDAATTHRGTVALFEGDVDRCHEIARRLPARPGLDDFSRRWSARALVNADALRGATGLALSTAEAEPSRSGPVGPGAGTGHSPAPVELMVGYCFALWRSGQLERAQQVADTYERAVVGLRDPTVSAMSRMLVEIAQLERGRAEAARASLAEASQAMGRDQPLFFLPLAFAELARTCVLLGDLAGAALALGAVEQAFVAPLPVFASALDRSRAWELAGLGRMAAAVDRLLDGAARAGGKGQLAQQAVLLHDVVRMGHPRAVAAELTGLCGRCDGDLVPRYAAHARAAVDRDAARLESLAGELAGLGDVLLAGALWAEAAVAHRADGRTSRAGRCAGEVLDRLEACGPVRTPALDRLTWQLRRLTPREAEVATLARRGLSNREIAVRTGCTVRTVENHLSRVYVKLGITGRDQLPATIPADIVR